MNLNEFTPPMLLNDVQSQIQVVSNLFVKLMTLETPGQKIHGHAHTYDHVTLLSTGSVWMRKEGQEERHDAPKLLVTQAGIEHEFECIEGPALLSCIHAIRDGDLEHEVAEPNIHPQRGMDLMQRYPLARSRSDS
jgi:quercetin dioxygenase-like cupin family protein